MKKIKQNLKGLTLVEMMMAIMIFTLGIYGFTVLFMKTWENNAYTLETGRMSMAASQGLKRIADNLRGVRQGDDGSYAILLADDNELVAFSDYDKDAVVERLHFYKEGADIVMGITEPTLTLPKTYPTGDQTVVTIVANVANEDDVPIFYYFNRDYPADMINNPVNTPAIPANIRLMKIFFQISGNSAQVANQMEMQTFVEFRNLNEYDRIQ